MKALTSRSLGRFTAAQLEPHRDVAVKGHWLPVQLRTATIDSAGRVVEILPLHELVSPG